LELRDESPREFWKDPVASDEDGLSARARRLLTKHALIPMPGASAKPYEWFFFWSSALEEVGILVITMNLVDPREARGFSIAQDPVPVIAVNGSEHFNGRIFTLMHEYAHVLLNASGLCDLHDQLAPDEERHRIEVECNRIASEILVPRALFETRQIVRQSDSTANDWPLDVLRSEARAWGVSPEVILRSLVDMGAASRGFYESWRAMTSFEQQLESGRGQSKQKGGDGLRTKVRNLGKGYVRLVAGVHNEGLLSTYEAANLLRSKTESIPKLLARAGGPESD
jgi:Zn-dependent peptidase ImmA (M78 family)